MLRFGLGMIQDGFDENSADETLVFDKRRRL